MQIWSELLAFIEGDADLRTLAEEVRTRETGDSGHDIDHCRRVAYWTVRIGASQVSRRNAVAAALLHDIVNVPKDSPDRVRASERSAEAAAEILLRAGFKPADVESIAEAIRDHAFSRGVTPKTALARALQDADRLEALGAIGICRCISTGAQMGARYFCSEDPWGQKRELDDTRYSLDHFFVKLLKLPETMNTDLGRAEALRRAFFVRGFVDQLATEIQTDRDGPPVAR